MCVLCRLPPPAHPAASPEHMKEPLEYMRKAQVQSLALCPSVSIFTSFFQIPQWSSHICIAVHTCVYVFTGMLGKEDPEELEQHVYRVGSSTGPQGVFHPNIPRPLRSISPILLEPGLTYYRIN